MTVNVSPRYCVGCGARLASGNRDTACRPCQRAAHVASLRPPDVPRDFWEVDQMRDALVSERHMGHVVRAYRGHPFHGRRRIPQAVMARWLSISQTQLSRIESGPPLHDLDRLVHWARVLRIPQELLWFDLPDDGDEVKRRQFLVVSGTTALATVPFRPGVAGGTVLTEKECAQWLAWELWRRGESSLPVIEIPRPIARVLKTLPAAGGMILRDDDGNYSFAHQSFIDFFVAQRVYASIAEDKSELLATAQTSHDTDQVIRSFVLHEGSSIGSLTTWMLKGATPVLRVNSAGILAKMGRASIADGVITALQSDRDTRHLYLTAVASRVLSMPWGMAEQFVGSEANLGHVARDLSQDRIADLAARLGHEAKYSHDGAARWCSVVLLGNIHEHAPATVTSTLQEALRNESCRENLRAMGNVLANSDSPEL